MQNAGLPHPARGRRGDRRGAARLPLVEVDLSGNTTSTLNSKSDFDSGLGVLRFQVHLLLPNRLLMVGLGF